LVDNKVISIGNVSYVLGMSSKKLYRWYRILSGFNLAERTGLIGKDDIVIKEKGILEKIKVPISKPENMGCKMAIDEKTINGTCYTILSNRQTNKIALMAATLKTQYLVKLLTNFQNKSQVESLTRDMAQNFDWLGRQVFIKAYHVIDKFHVIKNALDSLQAIRIRYRQEELAKRRSNPNYQEITFSNSDTELQLLARSRGLLFKHKNQWSAHQEQRATILFTSYPEIKQAYKLISKLRKWYQYSKRKTKTTYQKTRNQKTEKLKIIIRELKQTNIYELKNLAYTLKRHIAQIVNYFITKETNAKAEALNNNLQRFVNVNYGARNTDFFLYRVNLLFS
jgi:transposase